MIQLIIIAIVGVIVWGVTSLPMPQPFRTAIYVVCAVGLLLYLASYFGHPLGHFPH